MLRKPIFEIILNPFHPLKDKSMKNVNKPKSTQERNTTPKKTLYNVHDPQFQVEIGDFYIREMILNVTDMCDC